MTKYYRVRSQEQWDWLMEYFEKQSKGIRWCFLGNLPTNFNFYDRNRGNTVVKKNYKEELYCSDLTDFQQNENVHSFIEVSDLMEDEKMENIDAYQEVAKNYPLSADDVRDILYHHVFSGSTLKIKMTEAEKDEFDKLKNISLTLIACFRMINEFGYPHLDERLHGNNEIGQNNLAQNEFARALEDPSLIEVIKEPKYNVKVPPFTRTKYYFIKNCGWLNMVMRDQVNEEPLSQFTKSELKQYGLDSDMFEKIEVTDDGAK